MVLHGAILSAKLSIRLLCLHTTLFVYTSDLKVGLDATPSAEIMLSVTVGGDFPPSCLHAT